MHLLANALIQINESTYASAPVTWKPQTHFSFFLNIVNLSNSISGGMKAITSLPSFKIHEKLHPPSSFLEICLTRAIFVARNCSVQTVDLHKWKHSMLFLINLAIFNFQFMFRWLAFEWLFIACMCHVQSNEELFQRMCCIYTDQEILLQANNF